MNRLLFFLLVPSFLMAQPSLVVIENLKDAKQWERAETEATLFVKLHPSDVEGIELLGDLYAHQKKWDAAIAQYGLLVSMQSDNANFQYKYGGALSMKALEVSKLRALGMVGDISSAFLKAAALDPQHIEARWALVKLYMELPGLFGGSKRKALHYAEELQALSPVDGYLSKGYIHRYDKDFSKAETNFKKAVAVGGSKTCYLELAALYTTFDKSQKALEVLKEAYSKLNDDEILQKIKEMEN